MIRDLGSLRSNFEIARLVWDVAPPEHPPAKTRKPKLPDARERRLVPGDLDSRPSACAVTRNDELHPGPLRAVETGMRRGEPLSIRWADCSPD